MWTAIVGGVVFWLGLNVVVLLACVIGRFWGDRIDRLLSGEDERSAHRDEGEARLVLYPTTGRNVTPRGWR